MEETQLEKHIKNFIDRYTTLTLACCFSNQPWAADVYYVRNEFDLLFVSSENSHHIQIIQQNPCVAGTIHGEYRSWREIKGVQMIGQVSPVSRLGEKSVASRIFCGKYDFAKELIENFEFIFSKSKRALSFYKLQPSTIYYIDNSIKFGEKFQYDV